MKKQIMGLFGKVKIPLEWCDDCNDYSFVLSGIRQCCDKRSGIDKNEKLQYVRFSEGSGVRGVLSRKEKDRILKEQEHRCIYCGIDLEKMIIHFDHFIPFSFDYSTPDPDNMVASCSDCNLLKSNKIYESTEEVWDDIKEKRKTRRNSLRGVPRHFLPEAGVAEVLQSSMPILCVGQEKPKKKRRRKTAVLKPIKIKETVKKICPICNKLFITSKQKKIYCTRFCYIKRLRRVANEKKEMLQIVSG